MRQATKHHIMPPEMTFAPTEIASLRYLRHNLVYNISDGTMWLFGMAFVSTTTILPVYVSHLTASPVLIGVPPALESLGWYLPQIIVAPFVEGLARVKPIVMAIGLCERLLLLSIGIVIALVPAKTSGGSNIPLILFFTFLGVRMFVSGINAIPWQEMIARVIPTRQRGRFFAAQRFFGGITGLFGAAGAAWTLNTFEFPLSFALCFVFAFAAAMVSWLCLFQTIEPAQRAGQHSDRLSSYWRQVPVVLRQDRNFVAYLVGRALGYLGSMATGFFAVHAVQTFGLADEQAAVFGALLLGSNAVGSALWGWVGDGRGQKLVLVASSFLYAMALVLAWFQDGLGAYYLIFLVVGFANAGLVISDLAVILEFAPPGRRPTYMGIARSLLGPWIGLAPIIGGLLLAELGYGFLLVVACALTMAGLLMVILLVKEPRLQRVFG